MREKARALGDAPKGVHRAMLRGCICCMDESVAFVNWISFIELGRWGVECIYKKIPFIFHRFWTLLMS